MAGATRKFKYHQRSKGVPFSRDPYGLSIECWNEQLKAEFVVFREWRTAEFNLDRPRRLCQRQTTFNNSINLFEGFFGYLVNICGEKFETLRLSHVADPRRLRGFAEWHIQNRTEGKPSRRLEKTIGDFCRVARDYLKVPVDQWQELYRLRQAVFPDTKRDKRKLAVSLATLEEIAQAERPRLKELKKATTAYEKTLLAIRAQRSLYIRLLIYRPMRNRNVREMRLGEHLRLEGRSWIIEFRGAELKVGRRNGKQNVYRLAWPKELVPQLEEFLKVWRPLLPGHDRQELFTSMRGRPYTVFALNQEFQKAVFAYTGRPMNIHMVRSVWASEYFAEANDVTVAAALLGDTVETVMRCYVIPQQGRSTDAADRFVRKATKHASIGR